MNHSFKSLAVSTIAALSITSLSSCDLDSLSSNGDTCSWGNTLTDIFDLATGADCNQTKTDYTKTVTKQGSLLSIETVESRMERYPKDFSMALVLNEKSINKLFQASANWDFGGVEVGLPTIQVGGCRLGSSGTSTGAQITSDNCLSLVFNATVSGQGVNVTLGVPITTAIKGKDQNDGKGLRTSIFADLTQFQILNVAFNNNKLPSFLKEPVEIALKELLKGNLKRVFLFDVSAWKMGNGNIQLLAGGPVTNEKEGTLTLGMYSNIDLGIPDESLGETARVTWEESFPKDAEVGLHIHPDLIRGILSLMFHEQFIASDVTLDTASASSAAPSAFEVTMADMTEYPMQTLMTCGNEWRDYFTVGLRMWSTKDVCGYFDLLAGFKLGASTDKFELGIGNIRAGKAKGIGALAKIGLDAITNTKTFQDLVEQATLSFNYDQFSVPTEKGSEDGNTEVAQIATSAVDFRVDGNGISLYLNFVDF